MRCMQGGLTSRSDEVATLIESETGGDRVLMCVASWCADLYTFSNLFLTLAFALLLRLQLTVTCLTS